MTSNFMLRILGAGLFSIVIFFCDTWRSDLYNGTESNPERGSQRYRPYTYPNILPALLLCLFLISLFTYGFSTAFTLNFSMFFGVFIHISLYYILLICLLPFLRKHFTARACAGLWMIPNVLYIMSYGIMIPNMPHFVLKVPAHLFQILIVIWFLGFAGVMLWQIGSHLHFRHQILKGAEVITDPEILEIWQQELTDAGIKKPKMKLMRSAHVSSPLSVGIFSRSTRVLLPEKSYTKEELSLIFRHELVHICRDDSGTKFFLAFCTAMCWFNPLIWIASRKSAEDIELGCDETVLLDAQEDTRKQYADLILTTAGDDRGFSTCLSASANSLRYRLKNIVKPRELHRGAFLTGMVCFLLCISCGYVAVAQGPETGLDTLFTGDPSSYDLRSIYTDIHLECTDEDALADYLSGLSLYPISGNFSFDEGKKMTIAYAVTDNYVLIDVFDQYLSVHRLHTEQPKEFYYVPDGIDFELLNRLTTVLPALDLCLTPAYDEMSASLIHLQQEKDGITTDLSERCLPAGEPVSGYWGSPLPDTAQLAFSGSDFSGFTAEIQALDGSFRHTLSQEELEDPWILPLENVPARYTIRASLKGEAGSVYHAEFAFEIGHSDPS